MARRRSSSQAVVPRLGLTTVQSAKPARANSAVDRKTVKESVLKVFAEVTRYPLDILDPAASLEEDLGIDSVKLGEIFSVLREKYDLTRGVNIWTAEMRRIRRMSEALQENLATRSGANQAVVPRLGLTTVQSAKPAAANSAVDRKTVFHCTTLFRSEVTRYPLDILDPAASLEEDLGIDSVKLGEIFSVLREKYD